MSVFSIQSFWNQCQLRGMLLLVVAAGCGTDEKIEVLDDIESSLDRQIDRNAAYDLESSVRVLYALEEASANVRDVEDYARFLAQYDFSNVAPDVIDAQKRLIPVLRELYDTNAAKEENETVWRAFQDFQGPASLATGSAASFLAGDIQDGAVGLMQASATALKSANQKHKRDKAVARRLSEAERAYTAYLEVAGPVFIKYMKEWDQFCVIRDEAYLSIYRGEFANAESFADEALSISKSDRESLLLKVFSGLMKSRKIPESNDENAIYDSELDEYESLLEQYLELYPGHSAPALLLQGMIQSRRGNDQEAMMLFDESAIQYPKQAKALLEMMNPYESRAIFGQTAESEFVLELYKSSMEGFGAFSPNFHKAAQHLEVGNLEAAQEEVRMHFFRRGEQVVQDYLPTDLAFCQQHIPEVIDQLFVEKPFIDILVEEGGILDEDNSLYVSLSNQSNRNLENVRLFLCIHFTETYRNNYEVFRMPGAISSIGPYELADFSEPVIINFERNGKLKVVLDDVVHIRGVMVTDDIVTWVDSDDFKLKRAQESWGEDTPESPELKAFAKSSNLVVEEGYIFNAVKVQFDRSLVQYNPYVSLNEIHLPESVYPREKRITPDYIEYQFSTTSKLDDLKFLHLTCDLGSLKIPLTKGAQ